MHPTNVPGLSLVHSGTTIDNAAELVATRGARLLEEARSMADVVLLGNAPLLVVSDASALLPAVDAVKMVARAGQTSRDAAAGPRSCGTGRASPSSRRPDRRSEPHLVLLPGPLWLLSAAGRAQMVSPSPARGDAGRR